MASSEFLATLVCPFCAGDKEGRLALERSNWLVCQDAGCGCKYPVRNGIPVMLADEGERWKDVDLNDLPGEMLPAMPNTPDCNWLARKANELRITILQMVIKAGAGHIGGSYSAIDVLAALYFRVMKHDPSDPAWPDRDRLILSKGHCCMALYSVLAEMGYFRKSRLWEFCTDGGFLGGHPERERIPGVEATTGSLGHGLPLAIGMALACKMDRRDSRVFVVLGDGECNEGSVWEGFMSAPQLKLDKLVAIVDNNKLESLGPTNDILSIEPMGERLRSFGWGVREIDGHDMYQVVSALESIPFVPGKPSAIVANTVKGKGVSFMENVSMWHLRGPSKEETKTAFSELARSLSR